MSSWNIIQFYSTHALQTQFYFEYYESFVYSGLGLHCLLDLLRWGESYSLQRSRYFNPIYLKLLLLNLIPLPFGLNFRLELHYKFCIWYETNFILFTMFILWFFIIIIIIIIIILLLLLFFIIII